MFAHGHHTMMGSDEDPKDGGKVAAAVFGAVGVYGVREAYMPKITMRTAGLMIKTGLPTLLRTSGAIAQAAEPARRDCFAIRTEGI